LQWLEREATAARVLYEALSAQLRETVALQGLEPVVPEVLSQASAPSQPIGPGKSTVFGLSGFLGAIIGIGVVLFRESRHVLFYSARSLESATGRKVLGQIPELRQRRPQLVLRYLQQQQRSSFAEAFRSLRTSLEPLDGSTGQVILMTSAVPEEGKSIASLGLAHSFATAGRKVLLVDCDTRRPTLGRFLTHPNPLGLLDVLSGSVRLDEAVSRAPGLDIDFLLVEKGRRIAADLFSSESTDLLMSAFRQHYEIVIIDTPPLLAVNDARILARGVDKVLLVARWASTSASQLEEAMRLIEIRKQQISGLVLSRVDPRRMREYGIGKKSGPYAMLNSAYHDN
jgi:capsular exopolysaccharide synthesis family protein